MPSHRPAFRSRAPLSREGITHLGDERVHRIRIACIYLVARCKFGSDPSRHHRAIGAAQHVKDTATAPVLIGLVFVVLGFGFGESSYTLLKTIPDVVLGGLLLFSGIELALSSKLHEHQGGDLFLVLLMAAIGVALNPAAAFAVGLPIAYAFRREWLRV